MSPKLLVVRIFKKGNTCKIGITYQKKMTNVKCRSQEALKMTSQLKVKKKTILF